MRKHRKFSMWTRPREVSLFEHVCCFFGLHQMMNYTTGEVKDRYGTTTQFEMCECNRCYHKKISIVGSDDYS